MDHQINGIALPDEEGFFGAYGGQFIPPDLKQAMDDINTAYEQIRHTAEFQNEL
ncbi:MAG: tryptophan synthase subunit beta, partial [Acinetobacter sp.]|nr:tryptophan synthase subunit beta [Acinetobacter sp.]